MTSSYPIIRLSTSRISLKEDSITLEPNQLAHIRRLAKRKSKEEWHNTPKGIKIKLTETQQKGLIRIKDAVINQLAPSRNPKDLLTVANGFSFAPHSYERILERIERLTEEEIKIISPPYQLAVHPETLEKLATSLINANKVDQYAYWKAFPYLTFSFYGRYDDREIKLAVNFENGIFIVTVIVLVENGKFVRESLGQKNKTSSSYLGG